MLCVAASHTFTTTTTTTTTGVGRRGARARVRAPARGRHPGLCVRSALGVRFAVRAAEREGACPYVGAVAARVLCGDGLQVLGLSETQLLLLRHGCCVLRAACCVLLTAVAVAVCCCCSLVTRPQLHTSTTAASVKYYVFFFKIMKLLHSSANALPPLNPKKCLSKLLAYDLLFHAAPPGPHTALSTSGAKKYWSAPVANFNQ